MKSSGPNLNREMKKVVREWRRAKKKLSPSHIHHLRVSVRRCQSIAQGLLSINPEDPVFREIKQRSKKLLKKLGVLRDIQVKVKWLEFLFRDKTNSEILSLRFFKKKEHKEIKRARDALKKFNIQAWQLLAQDQGAMARAKNIDSAAVRRAAHRLAVQVRGLNRAVSKVPRRALYHRLRIAFKKYRYFTGQFMNEKEKTVERTLTYIQTVLGDAHDLEELNEAFKKLKDRWDKRKYYALKKSIKQIKRKNIVRYHRLIWDTRILKQL